MSGGVELETTNSEVLKQFFSAIECPGALQGVDRTERNEHVAVANSSGDELVTCPIAVVQSTVNTTAAMFCERYSSAVSSSVGRCESVLKYELIPSRMCCGKAWCP